MYAIGSQCNSRHALTTTRIPPLAVTHIDQAYSKRASKEGRWQNLKDGSSGTDILSSHDRGRATAVGRPTDANPTRVDDWDAGGITPLYTAVNQNNMALVLWLLEEKGANVNNKSYWGHAPLHAPLHDAVFLEILTALLDRGADPTVLNKKHQSALMLNT